MTKIKYLIDQIDEELCSAKEYAETYLEFKVKGDNVWASKYKDMALDELEHANYIHERTVKEIEALRKVYTPPTEMLEKWDKSHANYVEKAAWIKQMLAM